MSSAAKSGSVEDSRSSAVDMRINHISRVCMMWDSPNMAILLPYIGQAYVIPLDQPQSANFLEITVL